MYQAHTLNKSSRIPSPNPYYLCGYDIKNSYQISLQIWATSCPLVIPVHCNLSELHKQRTIKEERIIC